MKSKFTVYLFLAIVLTGVVIAAFFLRSTENYILPVSITTEKQQELESKVLEFDQKIKDFEGPVSADLMTLFVEKAKAEEDLGRIGDAIQTMKLGIERFQYTIVGWNNIARLYEKVGRYDLAIPILKDLVEQYALLNYNLDIAQDYRKMGDKEQAKEAYQEYLKTGQQDLELETYLNHSVQAP
jgi:tetratricopeptide (TPR) repeat protein